MKFLRSLLAELTPAWLRSRLVAGRAPEATPSRAKDFAFLRNLDHLGNSKPDTGLSNQPDRSS